MLIEKNFKIIYYNLAITIASSIQASFHRILCRSFKELFKMSDDKIRINAFVAIAEPSKGIGFKSHLPWSLPQEFKYYMNAVTRVKNANKCNALIFGRFTWNEWCKIFQSDLPNHVYIIISSTLTKDQLTSHTNSPMIYICKTYHEAIELCLNSLTEIIESVHVNGNFMSSTCGYQD